MMKHIYLLFLFAWLFGCTSSDDSGTDPSFGEQMYFPPLTGDTWATKSPSDLGWNETAMQPLAEFLNEKHTKSFIILVNGRIVMESYFNGHTATTPWYWASAGKTLTSTMTGIAEEDDFLDINDPVSQYLGTGWTSLTSAQENQITNRHLLTMTSGLDDSADSDCVEPACLTFIAAPGTRWAYDNVYVKLQDVVAQATGQSWNTYFNGRLRDRIGMSGSWIPNGDLSVYWSTTRSMARFGLLMLNKGKWDTEQIVNEAYCNNATNPSQTINNSYGYLWWINGEANYHLPQTQFEFNGSIIPSGASDMYMALGKNDQKIYVVPSKKMVVIRMGDAADNVNPALSDFDDELWQKINAVID
jgi:CubicO group peptidase (beta-lactamase class C family)